MSRVINMFRTKTARENREKPEENSTRKFRVGEFGWIWFGVAGLFIVSALIAPGTMRWSSLLAMLPFAGILCIVAVGQTVVIQQRGLDLSSAGMMSLAGMVVGSVGFGTGSMLVAVIVTLACALLVGAVNGILVARVNITPLVATLAVNALLIGGVYAISDGTFRPVPAPLKEFSHQQIFGLPYGLLLGILFVLAVAVVTKMTGVGRRYVAVGASPQASSAAGILVLKYQIGSYMAASLCFTVAGILYTGFIGLASHTAGNSYLMPGIAAVVVGGTPFTGGRGSVIASGVAALFMAQLDQMVLSLGAGAATQMLVQAAAIIIATTIRHMPSALKYLRSRMSPASPGTRAHEIRGLP